MGSGSAFPETLGDFRLVKQIGQGGMGVVFEAIQISLNRRVALKILSPTFTVDPRKVERFQREARSLAKLVHPNIMPIYQVGNSDGFYYFAMRLIDGMTLEELLSSVRALSGTLVEGSLITKVLRERNKPLASPSDVTLDLDRPADGETREIAGSRVVLGGSTRAERAEIGTIISFDREYLAKGCDLIAITAEALENAHQNGIIHRDIKPSNLMIDGESGRVFLTDFGLAREEGASQLTLTGQLAGTPAYMSPEQILGDREIDHRTDIYSLGITLFEFLTHRLPFTGRSTEELHRQVVLGNPIWPRKINPRLPRDLETIVLKAIDRWPGRRYQTAGEFASDLRRFLNFEPIHAHPLGVITRSYRFFRRNRALTAATISATMVAVLLLGWSVGGGIQDRRRVKAGVSAGRIALASGFIEEARERCDEAAKIHPDAQSVRRLFSDVELARAVRARAEYAELVRSLEALEAEVFSGRESFETEYKTREESAAYNRKETKLLEKTRKGRELVGRIVSYLELARSADPTNPRRDAVNLETLRFHKALAYRRGDRIEEDYYTERIAALDVTGEYANELFGRGMLRIVADVPGVSVSLVRYEVSETGEPRLIPTPCDRKGRSLPLAECPIRPGDVALAIRWIDPDGCAARLGIEPGDLIVGVEQLPLAETLLAGPLADQPVFEDADLVPFDRLLSMEFGGSHPMKSLYDFERWIGKVANAHQDLELVFETAVGKKSVTVAFDDFGTLLRTRPQRIDRLLSSRVLARDRSLEILKVGSGRIESVVVSAGTAFGADVQLTAYPVLLLPANTVGVSPCTLEVKDGSYLAVLRCEGSELVRVPILVARGKESFIEVAMVPVGTTPRGFVRIPEGTTILGGDEKAFGPTPRRRVAEETFFLSCHEVTWGEYFAFLNHYGPRGSRRVAAELLPEGEALASSTHEFEPPYYRQDDHPLYGITVGQAQRFIAWLNESSSDSRLEYFLPSRDQWEKAARGADGRIYPWGDVASWHLASGKYSRPEFTKKIGVEPVGTFLGDESPYGVLDLSGSIREWTSMSEVVRVQQEDGTGLEGEFHLVFGGSYMMDTLQRFRVGGGQKKLLPSFQIGFRVAARLRE